MTDFTKEERELAEWLDDHFTGSYLGLARELLKKQEEDRLALHKQGAEILRYAGCLDDIDDDVAELAVGLIPPGDGRISMADLTIGIQKIKDELLEKQEETTLLRFDLYRGSPRNKNRKKITTWQEAENLHIIGNDKDGGISIAFADAPDDYLWIKMKSHFFESKRANVDCKEASVAHKNSVVLEPSTSDEDGSTEDESRKESSEYASVASNDPGIDKEDDK